MGDAIKPLDPEVRRQNLLLRRLMPDATHVCCLCWTPLFGADDPHECHVKESSK